MRVFSDRIPHSERVPGRRSSPVPAWGRLASGWPAAILVLPLCAALATAVSGCGMGTSAYADVNPTAAKRLLVEVLDVWMANGKSEDLIEKTPPVLVSDMEWQSGAQLLSYEIGGDEKIDNRTIAIAVDLSARGKSVKAGKKRVSYHVTTSPPSVFRQN